MFRTVLTHGITLTCLYLIYFTAPAIVSDLFAKLAILGGVLFTSFQLSSIIDNVLPRFKVKPSKKAVFITGCDTGFGRLLAQRLDSLGYKVFAGCLEPNSENVRTLKKGASSLFETVHVDVTVDQSVEDALKFVEDKLGDCALWAIVNNAGIIVRGEAEWMPMDGYRKQFEVNTYGVVRVTKAFLPLLRKYKGRVVTTSSMGGRFTLSGFVAYCMSKHATNSFCTGLRMEMRKFGVKVITIEPFSHKSPMTVMSTVLQSACDTWAKRPQKLQKSPYTEEYFEAFKESVRRFNDATALSNIDQVIDAMVEAVCASSPHYSYTPGDVKSNLDMWFGRRLPVTFADYMISRTVTYDFEVEKYLNKEEKSKKEL